MIIELYRCDLCYEEHRPNGRRSDNCNGGVITICRDGINDQLQWEHLCPDCRKLIRDSIDKVILERSTNVRSGE